MQFCKCLFIVLTIFCTSNFLFQTNAMPSLEPINNTIKTISSMKTKDFAVVIMAAGFGLCITIRLWQDFIRYRHNQYVMDPVHMRQHRKPDGPGTYPCICAFPNQTLWNAMDKVKCVGGFTAMTLIGILFLQKSAGAIKNALLIQK